MADSLDLSFRHARRTDLDAIVRLLADDALGAHREVMSDPLPPEYEAAFDAIERDENNELIVAERGNALLGVLQVTYLPSLTLRGTWRALIEGVRVSADERGSGVGEALMRHVIQRAGERGCRLVQLTTNKTRGDALRFYERLGFEATHEGLKLPIEAAARIPEGDLRDTPPRDT